jgi:hypothetical protein
LLKVSVPLLLPKCRTFLPPEQGAQWSAAAPPAKVLPLASAS